ncbi:MAG: DUF72 domain-containing protein [Planctomycetota bacterium]|jgi:uncharacterized protein YecE (DUF72 family)
MPIVPDRLSSYLRIGTCSWKYDSWKGLIYDPEKNYEPNDYLKDYAEHYNTVEIDQWFWSLFPTGAKLPNPDTVRIYCESVPDDFLFTVKAPNSITLTHHYAKQPSRYQHVANKPNGYFLDVDLLKRFLDILQPMGKKLGLVMFQFEYLNRKKMPSLEAFLDQLAEFFAHAPKGFDYAIEIRNPNYLKQAYFDFLTYVEISPVLLEGYYMPPISEVVNKFDVLSHNMLLIRLMGPDRQKIEKLTGKNWVRVAAPKDESLKSIAQIVGKHIEQKRQVVVNVNNHYEGCAVLTIDRLIDLLQ